MTAPHRWMGVGRLVPICGVAMGLAISAGNDAGAQQEAGVDAQLAMARTALAKYADPIVAVHDGYFSTLACVEFLETDPRPDRMQYPVGGMGVHLFNGSLIGPNLDPARPQVLLYEPDGDKLRLVGAEWFVPVALGVKEAPTLFGRPFDGPMEGHHPLMPQEMHHWDLHVWLWKDNPAGMFSPTNPNLKCPTMGYSFTEEAPKLVSP